MNSKTYDVVVMGGGPGGSTTATVLARKGYRVLLLEKEKFPRFHIGESLLPGLWEIWDAIGITSKLEAANFVIKHGANFAMFNAPEDIPLPIEEVKQYFLRPYTYHVERARYDKILLDHARDCGVEVREEWAVVEVLFDGTRAVGVDATSTGNDVHRFEAPMIVDATGRSCLLARKLGWRRLDPKLNKYAYFTHFRGADRQFIDESVASVNTDIHTIDGGWMWYIPLSNDSVSVGAVIDIEEVRKIKGNQVRLETAIRRCPRIRDWTASAEQMMEVKPISNISYLNDRFVGDGFLLVGDAAMFVDPIFSAGVTLAMRGGMFAAETIHEAFEADDFSAARLSAYEARIRHPMGRIFKMIYNWYRILELKDPQNIISMARKIPILRERLIVLMSGGYDRFDFEEILMAAESEEH